MGDKEEALALFKFFEDDIVVHNVFDGPLEVVRKEPMDEIERFFYAHDSNCSKENMTPPNSQGLQTCLDCAGIFDADGEGIATTDKRLDKPR